MTPNVEAEAPHNNFDVRTARIPRKAAISSLELTCPRSPEIAINPSSNGCTGAIDSSLSKERFFEQIG